MKKFWTILAVAALFVACGGNDKKDEKKAEAEKATVPTDLSLFELKGNVKSVTYQDWGMCPFNGVEVYKNGSHVVSFDDSGNVVVPSDGRIIRDDKGVAVNIQYYLSDWDYWFSQLPTYDTNGRLKMIGSEGVDGGINREFYYDNEGRVSKNVKTDYCEGSVYIYETSYEYVAFDAQGNWTERVATTVSDWDGTNTETETRAILYY